nr:MAG TPA: hypothetical protein [Caudoviricetes sp.]
MQGILPLFLLRLQVLIAVLIFDFLIYLLHLHPRYHLF